MNVDPPEYDYPEKQPRHPVDLPDPSTLLPNALRRDRLGRWFFVAATATSESWQRVRWWNFILRRRIARAL